MTKNISSVFGAGFFKGQLLRAKMEKLDISLSFEDRIAGCQYLFLQQQRFECQINIEEYIDNIQHWDNFNIDLNIYQKALDYLEENKIQQCFDELLLFYKTNYRLKAFKELDTLYADMKQIRHNKRKDSSYKTAKDKAKIELDLKLWLDNNK
nr:hypothetical protein [Flavobacterium sp. ASV13]